MTAFRFIEPVDIQSLRGNQAFGGAGSFGRSMMPPWPSVAAGAIRSLILSEVGIDLAAFSKGEISHPELGDPASPGSFVLTSFTLAERTKQGVKPLFSLPADLVAFPSERGVDCYRLNPVGVPSAVKSSYPLPMWPALRKDQAGKPEVGYWLRSAGLQAYLLGKEPDPDALCKGSDLWEMETRVGIGLDPVSGTVAQGRLFSSECITFRKDIGFLVGIDGCEVPGAGMLRWGGDGRGARMTKATPTFEMIDVESVLAARACRFILLTPGIFDGGWRLPGMDENGDFSLGGINGRVVCASVARGGVVSGWDLATRRPKLATKVCPSGSVFWIEDLNGSPKALRKLVSHGLWPTANYDASRRAEGFNRFLIGRY